MGQFARQAKNQRRNEPIRLFARLLTVTLIDTIDDSLVDTPACTLRDFTDFEILAPTCTIVPEAPLYNFSILAVLWPLTVSHPVALVIWRSHAFYHFTRFTI